MSIQQMQDTLIRSVAPDDEHDNFVLMWPHQIKDYPYIISAIGCRRCCTIAVVVGTEDTHLFTYQGELLTELIDIPFEEQMLRDKELIYNVLMTALPHLLSRLKKDKSNANPTVH